MDYSLLLALQLLLEVLYRLQIFNTGLGESEGVEGSTSNPLSLVSVSVGWEVLGQLLTDIGVRLVDGAEASN